MERLRQLRTLHVQVQPTEDAYEPWDKRKPGAAQAAVLLLRAIWQPH